MEKVYSSSLVSWITVSTVRIHSFNPDPSEKFDFEIFSSSLVIAASKSTLLELLFTLFLGVEKLKLFLNDALADALAFILCE